MFRKTIKFLTIRVDQFNRFAILIHGCGQGLVPLTAADPRRNGGPDVDCCCIRCLAPLRREAFPRPPPA
jgi:hypothetical protein